MLHHELHTQLDRFHRAAMEADARQQQMVRGARKNARRGPVYGAALAGLGQILVTVGEALRAEYGEMVERGEQAMERFENRVEAVRQTSENPAV